MLSPKRGAGVIAVPPAIKGLGVGGPPKVPPNAPKGEAAALGLDGIGNVIVEEDPKENGAALEVGGDTLMPNTPVATTAPPNGDCVLAFPGTGAGKAAFEMSRDS